MRKVFAVVLSALVLAAWAGTGSRTRGQGQTGPALDERFCADANGDGRIDISDPVALLNFLFSGGAQPWCMAQGALLPSCIVCADGDVGIGTARPDEKLHVVGDVQVTSSTNVSTSVGSGAFKIVNAAGTAGLQFDTNEIICLGSTVFALNGSNDCETRINSTVFITTDKRVGIGTASPDYRLDLPNVATNEGGRGRANRWDTYSSRRWKEDIRPIADPLALVESLKGVRYCSRPENGGAEDIGFVAEDVARVLPEIVSMEPDGENAVGMDYSRVVPVLVEGMKAEEEQIQELRRETEAIRSENAELRAMLRRVLERVEAYGE